MLAPPYTDSSATVGIIEDAYLPDFSCPVLPLLRSDPLWSCILPAPCWLLCILCMLFGETSLKPSLLTPLLGLSPLLAVSAELT
jgi:hypothetical protein